MIIFGLIDEYINNKLLQSEYKFVKKYLEYHFIDKKEVVFYTNEKKIGPLKNYAVQIYEERDDGKTKNISSSVLFYADLKNNRIVMHSDIPFTGLIKLH